VIGWLEPARAHALMFASTWPGFIDAIGRGLREGFFMLWETLWALVLGFTLSGAVQAFVSRESMQRSLGNHGPAAVARASALGMASSSCSYAASAMAKSLFQKGADLVSSMVFMVASTNLVIELGLVLLVLIGWQFTAAEFVGGPIMIVLLALIGGYILRGPSVDRARLRLREQATDGASADRQDAIEHAPWRLKLRSAGAWADAATYSIADITMLKKELLIGYTVAGFLAALVPATFWADLFVTGHGSWTSIENAAIGPVIAVMSWVCSVGNVPLAAALWKGGISFGGVISFVFADLISMPLILVYRRLYGGRLTLRLVGVFYVIMAAAGLAVGALFGAAGIVPTVRRSSIVAVHFTWNYTTVLNIVFLAVFAGLWWMKHHRVQLGGGAGFAIDPVCGMQVRVADAPAKSSWAGRTYRFCSDRCRIRFDSDPEHFVRVATGGHPAEIQAPSELVPLGARHGSLNSLPPDNRSLEKKGKEAVMESHTEHSLQAAGAIDPVCHMAVDPEHAAAHRRYEDIDYYFCNPGCAAAFDEDPARYISE